MGDPKGTHYWLVKKCVVLFTFQIFNLPSVVKCRAIPICLLIISLVHQTLIGGLVTIGSVQVHRQRCYTDQSL